MKKLLLFSIVLIVGCNVKEWKEQRQAEMKRNALTEQFEKDPIHKNSRIHGESFKQLVDSCVAQKNRMKPCDRDYTINYAAPSPTYAMIRINFRGISIGDYKRDTVFIHDTIRLPVKTYNISRNRDVNVRFTNNGKAGTVISARDINAPINIDN